MVGAAVAASAMGAAATSAMAVPRATLPKPEGETADLAQAGPALEGEAKLEPTQFIVVRRRRRRFWRPWRRRRAVYFY